MDELEKLRYNDEFNAVYDAEIVQKKLENSARKEGEKQKEKEIAHSMLKKNFDVKTIMDLVGLSKEEILSLR